MEETKKDKKTSILHEIIKELKLKIEQEKWYGDTVEIVLSKELDPEVKRSMTDTLVHIASLRVIDDKTIQIIFLPHTEQLSELEKKIEKQTVINQEVDFAIGRLQADVYYPNRND